MKKMKKYVFLAILIFCSLMMTGCSFLDLFGTKIEKLEIEYTPNIQFFVGEDWSDSQFKATAVYSDDSTKDVTELVTKNLDNYDKTKAGKYKVMFEYEGLTVGYDVEVVNEMTHMASINRIIEPLFSQSFKVKNSVCEFKATTRELLDTDLYAKQTIEYKLENDTLKVYYIFAYVNEDESENISLVELLYVGDTTTGTMTNKIYTSDDGENFYYEVNSKEGEFSEFEEAIPEVAELYGASKYLNATQFTEYYETYYANLAPIKLTKNNNDYIVYLDNTNVIQINSEGFISQLNDITITPSTNIPNILVAE